MGDWFNQSQLLWMTNLNCQIFLKVGKLILWCIHIYIYQQTVIVRKQPILITLSYLIKSEHRFSYIKLNNQIHIYSLKWLCGRIFEIHIPKRREKRAPPDTLDISVTSSGFISNVQLRPSTAHWDECLNVSQSQFFTWDKRGR